MRRSHSFFIAIGAIALIAAMLGLAPRIANARPLLGFTDTPTFTSTFTPTVTNTPTNTATPTNTPTPTFTPTPSLTPTGTLTTTPGTSTPTPVRETREPSLTPVTTPLLPESGSIEQADRLPAAPIVLAVLALLGLGLAGLMARRRRAA